MVSAGPPVPRHGMRIVDDKLVIPERFASSLLEGDTAFDDDDVQSMLGDDEALEGIEAWLNQQPPRIDLVSRDREHDAGLHVESPAGWLLRLVRHARSALAARNEGEV